MEAEAEAVAEAVAEVVEVEVAGAEAAVGEAAGCYPNRRYRSPARSPGLERGRPTTGR